MTTHELKTWHDPLAAMVAGLKRFEFRRDDRNFQVGDVLVLREWRHEEERYTGIELRVRVTYVLRGPAFDVPVGFVVMSVEPTP